MKKFYFIFLLFITANFPAAQELHITEAQAPEKAPFAQPFTAEYHLSHSPEYQVSVDVASFPDSFAVTDTQTTSGSPGTTAYKFTVLPLALGKSTFTVSFQLNQGKQIVATEQTPLYVEVTPVQVFKDKKLREIRSPFPVHNWWWWLLLLLFTTALIYAIYLYRKRKQKLGGLSLNKVQDNRPCDVRALENIDMLVQSGLWEKGQYKIFYITLIDILREYLQHRFNLDVSAETSTELLAHIKTKEELSVFVTSLRELLSASDLIKFAKAIPNEQQRNRHILILRELIKRTTPVIQPAVKEQK